MMDETRIEWEVGRRAWKLFPRSAGILVTMVGAAIYGSIYESEWILNLGFGIWVSLSILRWVMLDIYMRNIWYLVEIPIKTISAWPILFGAVFVLFLIASANGMVMEEFFMILVFYFMAGIIEWIIFPR